MDAARRKFLQFVFFAIQGVIALMVSVPFLGYLLGPLFKKRVAHWVVAGKIGEFEENKPKRKALTYTWNEGFRAVEKRENVWIHTSGGEVIVYSSVCTHLGCNVTWKGEDNHYFCPCHDGAFALDGAVLAGPPPEPLRRLNARVENGIVQVQV